MRIDLSEVNALIVDMARAERRARPAVATVIAKGAHDIERDAKVFAPVDTGNLRNSIGIDFIGDLTAVIGPTAHYGHYVESGTSRMAPQPYMRPAAERNRRAIADAAVQAIERLL